MPELQVFTYESSPVRVIDRAGEPWWVLADVCKVLTLTNSRKVAERLDEDEKDVTQVYTPGGNQNMTIINESGLYKVILRSDKPEAKKFTRWVTHEVLPAIRKTGHYGESAQVEETTVALVNHDTLTKCASIMASCLEPNRPYVLNILRHIIPNIDQTDTVTIQVDEKPVEIPKLPAPEAAVVTTTKSRKTSKYPYFNGQKLKALMKERRLSCSEIAERIGVECSTVSTWRSGYCPPTNTNRKKLCAALGVRETYFDK